MDKTRVCRGCCSNPGSLSITAVDASVGGKREKETAVVLIVGGEEEGVGEVVVLCVLYDLTVEVTGGGFHLVDVALGCRNGGRGRCRMSREG
jgi:hypothetical protein